MAAMTTNKAKTPLGSPLKTPWRSQQHAEIQALLATIPNNITCICEICDCGTCVRNHKCKKAKTKSKAGEFPTTHTHDMFKGEYRPPRSSKRPPPTPRETDIAPMVFATNQRDDFIPRPIEMRKPIEPPKGNFERPSQPLDGISYYKQEFLPKKLATPDKTVGLRQKDMIRTTADAKFFGDTTNAEFFKEWVPSKSKAAEEPPCFTGELLYPIKEKLPESTTQEAYPGIYAPKPQQVKAAPDNLHVGGQGEFTTTTQDVYKGTFGPRASKFVPMQREFVKKGPLMAETQAMADYSKKVINRVRAVEPLQPTINLRFDERASYDTEQRTIFKGHDVRQHPIPKSCKKTPLLYEKPEVKMQDTTVTHSVFTPKNLADAYIPLQPAPTDNLVKNLPKFDGTTHNKEFFKDWNARPPRFYKHIDFADVYHPPEGKFQGSTTTKETFSTPLATGIPKSFKPEPKPIAAEGSHDFVTVHNTTYLGQPVLPCRARLWIMQQKLKENFDKSRHTTPLVKA